MRELSYLTPPLPKADYGKPGSTKRMLANNYWCHLEALALKKQQEQREHDEARKD